MTMICSEANLRVASVMNHGVCARDVGIVDINHLVRTRMVFHVSVVGLVASGSFEHDHDL